MPLKWQGFILNIYWWNEVRSCMQLSDPKHVNGCSSLFEILSLVRLPFLHSFFFCFVFVLNSVCFFLRIVWWDSAVTRVEFGFNWIDSALTFKACLKRPPAPRGRGSSAYIEEWNDRSPKRAVSNSLFVHVLKFVVHVNPNASTRSKKSQYIWNKYIIPQQFHEQILKNDDACQRADVFHSFYVCTCTRDLVGKIRPMKAGVEFVSSGMVESVALLTR